MEVYVEFKTWAEGPIETPWPFVIIEDTGEYRNRLDPSKPVSESTVRAVFLSFEQERVSRFLEEHTTGVLVGAIVDCPNIGDAEREITRIFGYCEMVGSTRVGPGNRGMIMEVMKHARDLGTGG